MSRPSSLTWAFYQAVKERSFCLICNTPDHQFHHTRPAHKIAEIGKLARLGNMDLLKHEFEKVVPLCDVHHRGVHRGHIDGWMDGVNDKGKLSNDHKARRFMPWLEVIGEPEIKDGKLLLEVS